MARSTLSLLTVAIEDFTLSGQALRARFFAAGDRYAHVVSFRTKQGNQPILESLEGSPDQAWPPGPPLQHLDVTEPSPGRKVALLLGIAGQSHWSLAAELVTSPDGEWLVFDFACRAAAAPEFLGSRYRLGPDTRWDAGTDRLTFPWGSARLRVDARTALVRPAPSPGEIEVVPRLEPLSPPSTRSDFTFPTTIRWKYAIEVSQADLA